MAPYVIVHYSFAFQRDRGKSPISCIASNGLWLSLVERLPRVQEAAGSNPASPRLLFS